MSEVTQRRIVIVGGGTAGWMSAAALARFLGRSASITLVESDEIGTVGVGEATIPPILSFNSALGLDEAEFVAATGGTFKLGIAFEGWGAPDVGYVHAFGQLGNALGVTPFHHLWLRGLELGFAKPLGHYILNTLAIAGNRFAHVERRPGDNLPPLPYAYHFDASLYAKFLRGYAEKRGVIRREGKIVAIERNSGNGDVAAVLLASGARVDGDLFVDCSGFRGLLIEQELEAGFEDWSHWLPCDRAIAVPSARTDPLVPLTRSTAHKAGWRWRIPLQHRTGNGHVFCSRHMSEDEATSILLSNLDSEAMAEPRTIRFITGRRRQAWIRNVVAIGLSAGFIEPLESTAIHIVQSAISRLIEMLPGGEIDGSIRDAYNRRTAFEIESIRDFITLHYAANGRQGESFWDEARETDLPDSLKQRIAMFRSSGLVVTSLDELFDARAWVQVMIGQGIQPRAWSPLADELEETRLREFLEGIEHSLLREVSRLPDHTAFVSRFAPAQRDLVAAS